MTPLVPLHPLPVEDLFHRIQIDHIGPITKTQAGHCHILVITECLSNYTMAIPVRSVDSKTTAKALFYKFVMLFGTPHIIQSDNASGFTSELLDSFMNLIKTENITSSAYAPRTQGTVERRNGILMGMIRRTITKSPGTWDQHLPIVTLALNNTPQATVGLSPYQIVFGRRCNMPIDIASFSTPLLDQSGSELTSNVARRIIEYQNLLKELKTEENIDMKERYDKVNRVEEPKYKVGDKVLIKIMDTHKRRHPKFQPKYRGPYTITEQLPLATYQIDTGEDKGLVNRVHADRLKL